jgi:hypothetical protein
MDACAYDYSLVSPLEHNILRLGERSTKMWRAPLAHMRRQSLVAACLCMLALLGRAQAVGGGTMVDTKENYLAVEQDSSVWMVLFMTGYEDTEQVQAFQDLASAWSGARIKFGVFHTDARLFFEGLRDSMLLDAIKQWKGDAPGFADGARPTGMWLFAREGQLGDPMPAAVSTLDEAKDWMKEQLTFVGAKRVRNRIHGHRWRKAAAIYQHDEL